MYVLTLHWCLLLVHHPRSLPVYPMPLSMSRSHVLGSSEQFPEGQSVASSAEHCPLQLTSWPQLAPSKVLSERQQVTLLESAVEVKARSKKSTFERKQFAESNVEQEVVSVESPTHFCAEHARALVFVPSPHDAVH